MRRSALLAGALCAATLAGACGDDDGPAREAEPPRIGIQGGDERAATDLGFPAFATKNTTRVGGGDSVAIAAATARAVWPAVDDESRPDAVVLVDRGSWQAGVAAAALIEPAGGPILLTDGGDVPDATAEALKALQPTGSRALGGARAVRVGAAARPDGLRTTDVAAGEPAEVARGVDALLTAAGGKTSDRVLVVSADRPEFAIPAAAWAAKSGDPVLFVERDRVPTATVRALRAHSQPKIYVLGPSSVISPKATRQLRRLGLVRRVGGAEPISNAIAFARYVDGTFGWNVRQPGHGVVLAHVERPMDAVAAAPLSTSGTHGPLLLQDGAESLPPDVAGFLRDIQPGYLSDPATAVYNHGWAIGDEEALPVTAQAEIDRLLEARQVEPSQP